VKVTVAIGDNYFIKCDWEKARKILADRKVSTSSPYFPFTLYSETCLFRFDVDK